MKLHDLAIMNSYDIQKAEPKHDECLKLRGQMMFIEEWDSIIFLASPM